MLAACRVLLLLAIAQVFFGVLVFAPLAVFFALGTQANNASSLLCF